MSQAQIGNLNVSLGINTAQFAAGLSQAQSSLATFGKGLRAFATGAAAVGIFSQSIAALKDVADMGDVAESIGITAEQMQVFNRLALASGASTDVMTRGLQSIAEQSVDTNSKLAELFAANGLVTSGKTINQIILDFMELLKNARTPAEQLAMATEVLGAKVGRQLVEALRTGSQGWQEEFGNMRESGNYLANESVADAQRIETAYNQAIASIATAWQRMVVKMLQGAENIATALDPIINPDFSKPTAGGELWRSLFGGQTTPGFGESPGFLKNSPSVNMGPMGGPGQFAPIPSKVSVLPVDPPKIQKITKEVDEAADALERLKSEGQTLWESTRTPIESYQLGIRNLNGLLQQGVIEHDTYDRAVKQLQDEFSEAVPAADEFGTALMSIGQTIMDTLGSAIEGLISGTMSLKDAFKSMTASVAQQLSQLAAQLVKSSIFKLLGMLAGGMAGGGGAGLNFGGMTFGGLFADGGNLGSGKWGIAGENGPEIIHGPAAVTPMSGASAPQMNVTVINNSSASVNTRKNSRGELEVMVEDMLAEKLIRGGNKIDAAMQRSFGLRRAGR